MGWDKVEGLMDKDLNEQFDAKQAEMLAEVQKSDQPEKLMIMSIMFMEMSEQGRTPHIRNGFRNILLAVMDKLHGILGGEEAEVIAFTNARESLIEEFEDERAA